MGSDHAIATSSIILFDGECNLCNGYVQFIIKRDPQAKFHFASLQSPWGKNVVTRYGRNAEAISTVLLLKNDKLYDKSNAVLEIVRGLNWLWPMLYIFKIVPLFIRNGIYQWVARNRYRWFGKRDECMVPTAEIKSRFIE